MQKRLTDLIEASGMVEGRGRCEIIAEELLCEGVMVPPCKVGDVVWWTDGCTRFAHKVEVTRISYTAEYGFDMSGFTRNQTHKMFNERDIGKTVFLTKEEAEKALAEREGKNNG